LSHLTSGADPHERTEDRDGMRVTWHAPIEADDGTVLRADVYRPIGEGRHPVILTYGVYGKGLAFQEAYAAQWEKMLQDHPEVAEGSSCRYMNWETADPERWVPAGYAVVRVDSRGAGWSPGVLDVNSQREIRDLYQCIEWAGTQPWSSGKVALLGISYYASNQWRGGSPPPPPPPPPWPRSSPGRAAPTTTATASTTAASTASSGPAGSRSRSGPCSTGSATEDVETPTPGSRWRGR